MGYYFPAKYDRIGTILLREAVCHGCRTYKVCVAVDNSGGEYSACYICLSCIDAMFAEGR